MYFSMMMMMMMILFLSLTWYRLWKKRCYKNDAHDTKNDKSLTYMA